MPDDAWVHAGKTMAVSGEGLVLTKTGGGNYNRVVTGGEGLSDGVHTWEVVLSSGATSNRNLTVYVGVAIEGLDVEKGNHYNKGNAWYIRTLDGSLYGGGEDNGDAHGAGAFRIGDRVGLRLDCADGSLQFSKNGELFGAGFPAGTITVPVVRAVELVCQGQSVSLVPGAAVA